MARQNPTKRPSLVDPSMDPEMQSTLAGSSTLGKQANAALPKPAKKVKPNKASDQAALMSQWNRVDQARAAKGLPSLPKPGTPQYSQ